MVGRVGVFVLVGSLFGVFPFFTSPTATVSVPLACAIITFLYFNWQGIHHHGAWGYLKSFSGGAGWRLVPLIVPAEIRSPGARLRPLPFRLFATTLSRRSIYGLF